jgi:hypothetical protein
MGNSCARRSGEIPLNSHSRYSATGKKLFKSFSVRGDRAAINLASGSPTPLISVGPTVRIALVHRFATSLLPAGSPTLGHAYKKLYQINLQLT